ncbi:MAG: phytanoyl-CoA dioxygenase family protein [Geminicoccaceae bacterium]|nr:phytanoyl-CoA dioxygenase family protein [Geminicoccaceae bacterium]
MSTSLPPEAVDDFRREGFWFPQRIMETDEADRIARRFMAFTDSDEARRYSDPQNQLYLLKAHLLFAWADRICHEPRLLDAVESFIGPDIMVWSSGVFWKAPHSGAHVSWHQDSTNFELEGADGVIRAWVALTPATLANGTMHFLPGAHVNGQIAHVDRKEEGELLSRGETIDLAIDHARTVPVLIEAGEVSFHHLHTPHGSGPNGSDEPRVNYVITFIRPDVRPRVGPDSAMLVRGHDRFGHFEHEPRPDAEFGPQAMRAHRRYLTMRNAILYRGAVLPEPPNHPV